MTTARTVEEVAQRITLRAQLFESIVRDEDEAAACREVSAQTLLARHIHQRQRDHHPKGRW